MNIAGVFGDLQMVAADILMENSLGISGRDTIEADVRRAKVMLEEASGELEMMLIRVREGSGSSERIGQAVERCTVLEKYIRARLADAGEREAYI